MFRNDGKVVGMVYMGIKEDYFYQAVAGGGAMIYQVPTSLTGCVPREPIEKVLAQAEPRAAKFTGRPSLSSLIEQAERTPIERGKGVLEQYDEQ